MYVEILSTVLAEEVEGQLGEGSLEHARSSRSRLLHFDSGRSTAHDALVNEIAYDRSLIILCRAKGIKVAPEGFSNPRVERTRLERALAEVGIDLTVKDRRPSGHG